jgi:hypothetical protein
VVRLVCIAAVLAALLSCAIQPGVPGSDPTTYHGSYLMHDDPPDRPQLFMPPEFRATADRHSAAVFAPDMQSFFWVESSDHSGTLFCMVRSDGSWQQPTELRLSGRLFDSDDPVFSPDGQYSVRRSDPVAGPRRRNPGLLPVRIWRSRAPLPEPGGWGFRLV